MLMAIQVSFFFLLVLQVSPFLLIKQMSVAPKDSEPFDNIIFSSRSSSAPKKVFTACTYKARPFLCLIHSLYSIMNSRVRERTIQYHNRTAGLPEQEGAPLLQQEVKTSCREKKTSNCNLSRTNSYTCMLSFPYLANFSVASMHPACTKTYSPLASYTSLMDSNSQYSKLTMLQPSLHPESCPAR